MSISFKTEEYYKRFIELQEKLRKSEEERLKLEMKFNEMVQVTREEEQMHYRKLKAQYRRFLEEDRRRQDRNERILRSLERIESRVAILIAKTERFKLLKQQYQRYMDRIYGPKPVEKIQPLPSKGNEKPKVGEGDIVETYLQNLSSNKLREMLRKEEESRGRLPSTIRTDSDERFDYCGCNEADYKPNYANSIADDIMSSIYSHKTDDKLKNRHSNELNNNGLGSYGNVTNDALRPQNGKTQMKYSDSDDVSDVEEVPYKNVKNPKEAGREDNFSEQQMKNDDLVQNKPLQLEPDLKTRDADNLLKKSDDSMVDSPQTKIEDFDTPVKMEHIVTQEEHKKKEEKPKEESLKETVVYPTETLISEQLNYVSKENLSVMDNSLLQHKEPELFYNEESEREVLLDQPQEPASEEINDVIEELPKVLETAQPEFQDNGETIEQVPQESILQLPQECIETEQTVQSKDQPSEIQQYDENIRYDDQQYAQQYDENEQPIEASLYNEQGQLVQQYDADGQPIKYDQGGQLYGEQYDENAQYDEQGQYIQQYDENGQPIQQYAQQYDENGQPIQQYPQQYDENGQPIQQYDDQGQFLQQYDENGQPIQQYVQQYDENGQPISQYDENGQFIQQYDESGQPYQQYDESGQVQQYGYDENAQYDENGQLIQQANQNFEQSYENNAIQEENKTEEVKKADEEDTPPPEEPKIASNVMEMLDTDTESTKQEAKVSHDSDFDFSNE